MLAFACHRRKSVLSQLYVGQILSQSIIRRFSIIKLNSFRFAFPSVIIPSVLSRFRFNIFIFFIFIRWNFLDLRHVLLHRWRLHHLHIHLVLNSSKILLEVASRIRYTLEIIHVKLLNVLLVFSDLRGFRTITEFHCVFWTQLVPQNCRRLRACEHRFN